MSMRDPVTVLDVRGLSQADVPRVVAWCALNRPGRIYVGDWCIGTATQGWSEAKALALQWAVRAECWRQGIECLAGWGIRLDVLTPRTNRGLASDAPTLVTESTQSIAEAFDAWPDGWTIARKQNVDGAWYDRVLTEHPKALGYVFPDCTREHLEVFGFVGALESEEYRSWAVQRAGEDGARLGADFAIVGVKPWLREGSAYMNQAPSADSNLIQPPTIKKGIWAFATSELLTGLSQWLPVVTMVRPSQYALHPEQIGLGGAAVESVTGEIMPGVLPS